jgi:SNF2 family DNA or RNA helicase
MSVTIELMPHQVTFVEWMKNNELKAKGGILAVCVGAGKSLTALSIISPTTEKSKTLVIAPVGLIHQWQFEIQDKTTFRSAMYYGKTRTQQVLDSDVDIILASLTSASDSLLMNYPWYRIICDEIHNLRNGKTKAATALCQYEATMRWGLSGTVFINGTDDLFSLCLFLRVLDHESDPAMSERQRQQMLKKRFKIKLNEGLLEHIMLRRTLEDIQLKLPPKYEEDVHLEMTKEERHEYGRVEGIVKKKVEHRLSRGRQRDTSMKMLAYIVALRQAANDLRLLMDCPYEGYKSIKIQTCLDIIQKIVANSTDEKVIIFSEFLGMMGFLGEELKKLHIPYLYYIGEMKVEERDQCLKNFRSHSGTIVLIASKTCSSTGLNITDANVVILLSSWYNRSLDNQAIARAHRIGQTKPVYVYKLAVNDTIDQRINAIAERKEAEIQALLNGQSGNADAETAIDAKQTKLTSDEYNFLFDM